MSLFISNDSASRDYIMEVDSKERAQAECDRLRVESDYQDDYTAYEIVSTPIRTWRVPAVATDASRVAFWHRAASPSPKGEPTP